MRSDCGREQPYEEQKANHGAEERKHSGLLECDALTPRVSGACLGSRPQAAIGSGRIRRSEAEAVSGTIGT